MPEFVLDEAAWAAVEALADGPAGAEALAARTGLPLAQVIRVLKRLERAGIAGKEGETWRLLADRIDQHDLRAAEPAARVLASELAGLARARLEGRRATATLAVVELSEAELEELEARIRDWRAWLREIEERTSEGGERRRVRILFGFWEG